MRKRILITGSSGLIGTELKMSLQNVVEIHELSRSASNEKNKFHWDIAKGMIEQGAVDEVDTIIHLAGAGIADQKWTRERKKELFDSRIESTKLLYKFLKNNSEHKVKTLVCASAIGYYGFDRGKELVDEGSPPGEDFLAGITVAWEKEAAKFEEIGIRVVNIRIGIVLSKKGGALKEIIKPVKWMAGAALGSGKQYMSWIHMEDMVRIIEHAVENENMQGPYNAVAPNPETNKNLTKVLARVMKKPFFLPPVPGFVLKAILGEMAVLVLGGLKVSGEKIRSTGFMFNFPNLQPALEDLINNK